VLSIGVLLLIALMAMLLVACGTQEESTTSTTAQQATTTSAGQQTTTSATMAETTTTAAAGQPVYGGILKIVHNSPPAVMGMWAKTGPTDEAAQFPGVERIMKFAPGRKLVPDLAESVVEDPDALTITVKLHQGVKFTDGTELTSEVAKWNYDQGAASGKLQFADAIKEFEIVDNYNYVLHLNYWHNQLLQSLGWVPMYSMDAYMKSGATEEERQAWATEHLVGTGPFILKQFNRDQSLIWEKNPNYWQEGQPYLDGIEVTFLTDPATAQPVFESGQADIWQAADAQARSDLLAKGYTVQTGWAGFQYHLMPNTMDPASPMAKQEVREALEYALDKPAICKAIGYGFYFPIYAVSPEGEWGSDAIKVKREYDPEKAKQLLAAAGYANGCPIDLLAVVEAGGSNTAAEAIKGYLDAAGFVTNIDIADPGRFYGSVFGTGWKDVALMFSGNDYNYLMSCNAWWSPTPKTNLASFKRPDDFGALFKPADMARTEEEQKAKTGDIVAYINEHALMVPVFHYPNGIVIQKYVHTEYPMEGGFVRWSFNTTWMDAH
jgi:peptide/nickel transport system substrate-binding protein